MIVKDKLERKEALKKMNELEELLGDDGEGATAKEAVNILEEFKEKLDEFNDFSKGNSSLQSWVEANRMLKGKPFDYENAEMEMMLGTKDKKIEKAPRPYLKQYINDTCRDKTIIKSRQTEFTENEINENIYLATIRPFTNISHIFPTTGMGNKMAKEKISIAIDNSPRISIMLKRPLNLTSKSFRNGSFYTVDSSWTDYQGRGPSRDKITFDEYESQNPQIEDIYSESTSHSELGRKTRISTPKFPNSGIDEKFNRGCQYEWFITCPKCKKEQRMEFPENVINFFELENISIDESIYMKKIEKVYIGCKFCGTYIDKTSSFYLKNSRWLPARKHLILTRASYRVTYMMLPWKTGKEILYKYHTFKFTHQFWNEVMGFAYVSAEAQLDRSVFERCQDRAYQNRYQRVGMAKNLSMGVDWGMTSWVVIRANGFPPNLKKPKVIYVERINKRSLISQGYQGIQTDHTKRVDEIMGFFGANILINDANGIGVDRNAYLVKRYPTRCYGVFYDTEEQQRQKKKENLIVPRWNETARTVTVSRVATMKLMIQEYEEKGIEIPRLDSTIEAFIKHHSNLVVERYVDERTGALFEVVGKTGEDHLAHADNYAKIGFDKMVNIHSNIPIGIINTNTDIEKEIETNIHPLYND